MRSSATHSLQGNTEEPQSLQEVRRGAKLLHATAHVFPLAALCANEHVARPLAPLAPDPSPLTPRLPCLLCMTSISHLVSLPLDSR